MALITTKLCQNAFQTIPVKSIFGEQKKCRRDFSASEIVLHLFGAILEDLIPPLNTFPVSAPPYSKFWFDIFSNVFRKFQISIGQGRGLRLGRNGWPRPWPIEIWNLKIKINGVVWERLPNCPTAVWQPSDEKQSGKTKCFSNDRSRRDDHF